MPGWFQKHILPGLIVFFFLMLITEGNHSSFGQSQKFSPFELLYGRSATLPIDTVLNVHREKLNVDQIKHMKDWY